MQFSTINVTPKAKVLLVHISGQMEVRFITNPHTIYNVCMNQVQKLEAEMALAHIICFPHALNKFDLVALMVQILM